MARSDTYPLKKIPIYTPILSEQKKIASFLSSIDSLIENLGRKKELLERYKKGVMQKIFSKQIRFMNEKGEEFPAWRTSTLGKTFSALRGKGLSKESLSSEGTRPCLLYGELYTEYREVIDEVKSRTNENVGVVGKVGDLLIPSSTTTSAIDLARVAALRVSGALIGGDITILRSKISIDSTYFAYYLSSWKRREVARYAQGVTIFHLSFNHFKCVKIEVPSYDEQKKIATFLAELDCKIQELQQRIGKLELWKRGLLQKMFV